MNKSKHFLSLFLNSFSPQSLLFLQLKRVFVSIQFNINLSTWKLSEAKRNFKFSFFCECTLWRREKNRAQNDWSENIWLQLWLYTKRSALEAMVVLLVQVFRQQKRQDKQTRSHIDRKTREKGKRNKLKTEIKVHLELNWSLQGIRKFHSGFCLCQKTEKGPWKKAKKGKHCFNWFSNIYSWFVFMFLHGALFKGVGIFTWNEN